MNKKLALETGGFYTDYYDHQFDRKDSNTPIWNRNNRKFPNRSEQFAIIHKYFGCNSPNSEYTGIGLEPCEWWNCWGTKQYLQGDEKLVVYTDETFHMGQGKIIHDLFNDPMPAEYLQLNAVMFFENPFPERGKSLSKRLLAVGNKMFWIEYVSYEEWQSNVGDGEINILEQEVTQEHRQNMLSIMRDLRSPLLAIDFVPNLDEHGDAVVWYATDLNLAPGIKSSGIEKVLSATEFVQEIKNFYFSEGLEN